MAVAAPLHAVPDLRLRPRPRFRLVRARCVRRTRLVRRLAAAKGPLVVLAAPVGYGKTALLEQWDDADDRPFAWLSAVAVDRDPVELLGAVADRVDAPTVVVLDDAHLVRDREALDVLRGLLERTAPGSLLVLASRGDAALPLGRARAAGLVTELGPADLAMTETEATTFLRREGLELTFAETERIVALAEGWPAGLRLAALALREQDDVPRAAARFAGDDRVVADYVRDELLAGLRAEEVALLTRTSPLETLTGPLCDAVLATERSGCTLRRLARSGVLLAAVDRSEERFRLHPLLAGMLRGELRRDEPGREDEVHRRAGAWHEAEGELEPALDHFAEAGDAAAAARLIWRLAPAYAADGRAQRLDRWLGRFAADDLAGHAPLALSAALRSVACGDRDAAQRWAEATERARDEDEPSLGAGLALVRAAIAPEGAARMGEDAARALTLADPDGPLRASACLLGGVARRMTGDRDGARGLLEEGARRSREGASTVQALCLAQLALLALDEGDRERAMQLADRARESVGNPGDPGCAAAFAAAALTAALGGRVADARRDVDAARRLMPPQGASAPWAGAELRMVLARAELRLSDAAAARELLTDAARLARATPDATALQAAVDDAWEAADTFAAGAVAGPTSLTTAELRVLRFLPSHLSFREIAARLHVSANTVKSQAHAVYRKLDASSRSEAVARARDVGLVDG